MAQTKNEFGHTLLSTATASASATIDFDTGIDFTKYKEVVISGTNIVPATDDQELLARVDYGAGYLAASYINAHHAVDNGGVGSSAGGGITTGHQVCGSAVAGWGCGNAANERASFVATFYDINDSGAWSHFYSNGITSNGGTRPEYFGGYQQSTGVISGIRLLFASGDITSGEFKLYGVN